MNVSYCLKIFQRVPAWLHRIQIHSWYILENLCYSPHSGATDGHCGLQPNLSIPKFQFMIRFQGFNIISRRNIWKTSNESICLRLAESKQQKL